MRPVESSFDGECARARARECRAKFERCGVGRGITRAPDKYRRFCDKVRARVSSRQKRTSTESPGGRLREALPSPVLDTSMKNPQ